MWRSRVGGCPHHADGVGDVLTVGPRLHQSGREERFRAHRRAVPFDPGVVGQGRRRIGQLPAPGPPVIEELCRRHRPGLRQCCRIGLVRHQSGARPDRLSGDGSARHRRWRRPPPGRNRPGDRSGPVRPNRGSVSAAPIARGRSGLTYVVKIGLLGQQVLAHRRNRNRRIAHAVDPSTARPRGVILTIKYYRPTVQSWIARCWHLP